MLMVIINIPIFLTLHRSKHDMAQQKGELVYISGDHAGTMILGSPLAPFPLPLKVYEHVSLLFISTISVSEQFIYKQTQSSQKIQKNYKPSNNYSAFNQGNDESMLVFTCLGIG